MDDILFTDQEDVIINEFGISNTATMSFEEFDAFVEQASEIELFNLKPYWPTLADIDKYAAQFPAKKVALFFTWLLESNGEPVTAAEKMSRKIMNHYIRENLELAEVSSA